MSHGSAEDRDSVILNELKYLGVKLPKSKKLKSIHTEQEYSNLEITPYQSFGVRLLDQEWILSDDKYVPRFLALTSEYLFQHRHSEGLFRKTGSVVRQKKLRIDVEKEGTLENSQPDDVASILKQWLRELPEPVIPFQLYDLFIRCHHVEPASSRTTSILLACLLLPPEHLQTLCYLLHFLKIIANESATNKMDAHNLALIIAPNLMPYSFGDRRDKSGLCVLPQRRGTTILQGREPSNEMVHHQTGLVQALIENADMVGEVPLEVAERLNIQDLDMQITDDLGKIDGEAPETGQVKSRKKRRSGTVQELMTGIKKFVGLSNLPSSKECSSQWNKENETQRAPVTRSSSKRKADADLPSLHSPKKQILEDVKQHFIAGHPLMSGEHTKTYSCDTCCTPNSQVSAKPRRKSLGILRKQRKGSHTPSKNVTCLSEKKTKEKCRHILKSKNNITSFEQTKVENTGRRDSLNDKEIIEKVNSLAISSPEITIRKSCRAVKRPYSPKGTESADKEMPTKDLPFPARLSPVENYNESALNITKPNSAQMSLQSNRWPPSSREETLSQKVTNIRRNTINLCQHRIDSNSPEFSSVVGSGCKLHNSGISESSLPKKNATTSKFTSKHKMCQTKSKHTISPSCLEATPQTKVLQVESCYMNEPSEVHEIILPSSLETPNTSGKFQFACNIKKTEDMSNVPTPKHTYNTSNQKNNESYRLKLRSESKNSPQHSLLSSATSERLLKRNSSNKTSLRRGRPNTVLTGLPSSFRAKHSSDPTDSNVPESIHASLEKTHSDGALVHNKSDDDCIVKTLNFSDVFHPDALSLSENFSPETAVIAESRDHSLCDEADSSTLPIKNTPHLMSAGRSETEKFNDSGLGRSTEEILNSSLTSRKSFSSAEDLLQLPDANSLINQPASDYLNSHTLSDLPSPENKYGKEDKTLYRRQKSVLSLDDKEKININSSQSVSHNLKESDTFPAKTISPTSHSESVLKTTVFEIHGNAEASTLEPSCHEAVNVESTITESADKEEKTPVLQKKNLTVADNEKWISAEKFLCSLEPPSLRDESHCQRESVIKLRNRNAGMVQANVQRYNSILSTPSQLPKRMNKSNNIPVRVPSIFNHNSASMKEAQYSDSGKKSTRRRSSSFGSRDGVFIKPSLPLNQKKTPRRESKGLTPRKALVQVNTLSPKSNSESQGNSQNAELELFPALINNCELTATEPLSSCSSSVQTVTRISYRDTSMPDLICSSRVNQPSDSSNMSSVSSSDVFQNEDSSSKMLSSNLNHSLQATGTCDVHNTTKKDSLQLVNDSVRQMDQMLDEWEVNM